MITDTKIHACLCAWSHSFPLLGVYEILDNIRQVLNADGTKGLAYLQRQYKFFIYFMDITI